MARAGYNPREAVAFWKRMLRASKGKEPPEFASDHPSDKHRVERVQEWLPEAERSLRAGAPELNTQRSSFGTT
jgi:metalloendopeptidase OMA1, mitochondrial